MPRTTSSGLVSRDRTNAMRALRSFAVSVSITQPCQSRNGDDDDIVRSDLDFSKLHEALKGLLKALPDEESLNVEGLSPSKLRQLRLDIGAAMERLLPLSRVLDPIKRPQFVFDPTNPEIVGQLIGRTMMEQPRQKLGAVPKFYGSGVYAIYYSGDFSAYRPIRKKDTPIYVGKADPPTPDAKTVEEQGPKLSARLGEHAKSVRAATTTLSIADFEFRFLVVQSGWQRSAEDYLLNLFHPVWNSKTCYGFGKHGDDPKTRANTRSPWDTLHPGRPWATREGNVRNSLSVADIQALVREHFSKYSARR